MNKVLLSGWIETEPNIRYFSTDLVRADFRLRTEEHFPQVDGTNKTILLRHNIQAWGDIARVIETQGRIEGEVKLEGRLTYDKQIGPEGESHTIPVIDCTSIEFISTKATEDYGYTLAPAAPLIDWTTFAPEGDEDPMA